MKNNNFLIALALCLGLSSAASFCSSNPNPYTATYQGYPAQQPVYQQTQQPVYQQPATYTNQPTATYNNPYTSTNAKTTPSDTPSSWSSWFSPSAWYASAKSRAQSVASSTLDMANAVRSGVGLENITYKTLGAAIAALVVLGYNREKITTLVDGIYKAVEPALRTVGGAVKDVVTNPVVAGTIATAAAVKTVYTMDEANEARKATQTNRK
jgi:hypothetical protein